MSNNYGAAVSCGTASSRSWSHTIVAEELWLEEELENLGRREGSAKISARVEARADLCRKLKAMVEDQLIFSVDPDQNLNTVQLALDGRTYFDVAFVCHDDVELFLSSFGGRVYGMDGMEFGVWHVGARFLAPDLAASFEGEWRVFDDLPNLFTSKIYDDAILFALRFGGQVITIADGLPKQLFMRDEVDAAQATAPA